MVRRPALFKGEMEIARLVWQLGKATVRRAHGRCRRNGRWILPPCSWHTYRRLEARVTMPQQLAGHTRVYASKVHPITVIRETVEGLIDQRFSGAARPCHCYSISSRIAESMPTRFPN